MSEDICQNMGAYGVQCVIISLEVTARVTATTVHFLQAPFDGKRDLVEMAGLSCSHVAQSLPYGWYQMTALWHCLLIVS